MIQGTVTAAPTVSFKPGPGVLQGASISTEGVPGAVCTLEGTDKSATTDEHGFFQMTDVAVGSYILICQKTAADGTVYAFLKMVDVQSDQTADLGTMEITPTGSIQGTATLVDQTDHIGITIYIPGTSFQARTDSEGAYLINDIPEGTYKLRFEHTGYGTAQLTGIIVTSGETTVVSDVALNLSTGATGSITIENGRTFSNSRTVTVSITASADATLMQISEDPNFVGAVWNPIPPSRTWIFTSDGEKRLYIKLADANGLESAPVSDSIIIDTIPPADGRVIINHGALFTNSLAVTLTVSATDATTSVAQMKISNDPQFTDAAWESFTSPHSWSLPPGDGTKTVYVQLRDLVGNETAAVSTSIALDTTLPTSPSISIQAGSHTNSLRVQLNLFASGSTFMKISEDPTFAGASPTPFASTVAWALSAGDGTKTVYVTYLDDAGNETAPVSAQIVLDTTPPSPPVIFNQNQTTAQTTFVMTLSAPSIDTNFMAYQLKGGQYSDWADVTESTSFSFTLTQQGPNILSIRGKDLAGNASTAASVTVTLDTVNPILSTINASTTCITVSISWQTSEPTTGQVDFGFNQDYGSTQSDTNFTPNHSVLLTGLSPSVLYHYRITSSDIVGHTTTSTDLTFTTQMFPSSGCWTTKASMPTARFTLAVGVVDGILYAVGGYKSVAGSSPRLATIEAYDPATNTWTTKASMPTAREDLAVGVVDGILYAVGGFGYGSFLATVEAYDPATDTWTTKASMPTGRSHLAVGVVNGILYAVSGYNSLLGGILATVEAYDPATDTWTTKASMPTAQLDLAVGVVDGILYAVGGRYSSFLATVEAYDPATNTWTTRASMPTARSELGVGVVNGTLYAVGGLGGIMGDVPFGATVEAYDPATNTWTTRASMPTARSELGVGVVNGTLYAVGGTNNLSNSLATVEAYEPPP